MKKRLKVTRLERVAAKRFFGKLLTRELFVGGELGDVSVVYERMAPRTDLPRVHHRKTSEFIYCLSGKMTAELDGRRYRVRAGGILFLPPNARHKFTTGASPCEALSIFAPSLRIRPDADIHTEA
ncbi:MAG: cupin domain-containing protein [Elusimicrobia bacterium]|nr:cupin domain-containing protein [Elusimicrobiota bacterium]